MASSCDIPCYLGNPFRTLLEHVGSYSERGCKLAAHFSWPQTSFREPAGFVYRLVNDCTVGKCAKSCSFSNYEGCVLGMHSDFPVRQDDWKACCAYLAGNFSKRSPAVAYDICRAFVRTFSSFKSGTVCPAVFELLKPARCDLFFSFYINKSVVGPKNWCKCKLCLLGFPAAFSTQLSQSGPDPAQIFGVLEEDSVSGFVDQCTSESSDEELEIVAPVPYLPSKPVCLNKLF
jgi:hypothetical protein